MAASRKRKARTVVDENYSRLDEYTIGLNEYYKSLRRAGFSVENALWLLAAKESHPDWMQEPTPNDIAQHFEDEEDN